MGNTKLTDFTTAELSVLLDAVVIKIVDEETHRKEWRKWFAGIGNGYYEGQEDRLKTYTTLCLWRTQILNAIGKVGVQEEINSN